MSVFAAQVVVVVLVSMALGALDVIGSDSPAREYGLLMVASGALLSMGLAVLWVMHQIISG